jgi:hypothetical protein
VTELALWVRTSSFVQHTVPPAATLLTAGANWFPATILTGVSVEAHGPGCALARDPMTTTAAAKANSVKSAANALIAP